MNKFSLSIKNLQHIKELKFEIDISNAGIMGIVGKNGVGKTILFKAIQNLITSNTFKNTSNDYIYKDDSKITYLINETEKSYEFKYNHKVKTLDFKGDIEQDIIDQIFVELPIPFGQRFKQFQKLGSKDKLIRTAIISDDTTKPKELIELLNYIYDSTKFDKLIEIIINKEVFYAIILDDYLYIREDYLSSGEYFIINIYKYIKQGKKFISIDEIDISLDAMAQVRLIEKLRILAEENKFKLLFSTHSLALIKTLQKEELFYMELNDGICTYEKKSYNYIKSLLFGFHDYDKYILTEDEVLKSYIEYMLLSENIFSKYIVIPIGGASNIITLMETNKRNKIFDIEKNVLTVLDGDMKDKKKYKNNKHIYFSPFDDIEDCILEEFKNEKFGTFTKEELKNPKKYNIQRDPNHKDYSKSIYKMLINKGIKSQKELFDFLTKKEIEKVGQFKNNLICFLNR